MKTVLLASAFTLGLSGAVLAQSAITFTDIDTDGSGTATMAEVQAGWPDLTEAAFVAADTDVSGDLTEAEYDTLAALSAGISAGGDGTIVPQ